MDTVETPFRLLCTVYSNSSIIENKMHIQRLCVFVYCYYLGPNVPTSIVIPVNSNLMGICFRSP